MEINRVGCTEYLPHQDSDCASCGYVLANVGSTPFAQVRAPGSNGNKGYENSGSTEYPTWQLVLGREEIRRVFQRTPLLSLGHPYLVIAV